MNIEAVGVIGAGTMGDGIAQVFAIAGFDVVMQDLNQEALDSSPVTLERMVRRWRRLRVTGCAIPSGNISTRSAGTA